MRINTPFAFYKTEHTNMNFDQEYQFMVDFTLPDIITEEFMQLIPVQRRYVGKLFREGKILTYSLSLENCKLWAIFVGTSEMEIEALIHELPMAGYMSAQIHILTFHDANAAAIPEFSLN